MSWIQRLYETYEMCANAPQFEKKPLLPVSHTQQQAHIEIILDEGGNFQRAVLLDKETTVVPATEKSALRTGTNPPPHPLCDKIRYCASDYKTFGGRKKAFFEGYVKQLREWHSEYPNVKVGAVLQYVGKGGVVADLVRAGVLHCGPEGTLLAEWISDAPTPGIFPMLTANKGKRDQGDAFVRWRVQVPGDPVSAVSEDPRVRDSWIRFDTSRGAEPGLCMVTGEMALLALKHPKGLRHGADGAKLISSDDRSGYTFRGRTELACQTYGVGSSVTQKAHSALRWLIERQGNAGDQVFLAWAVSGKRLPDPLADTARLFKVAGIGDIAGPIAPYEGDVGQHFALRLRKAIAGYRAELGDSDGVVIVGLDSATPGRMAITFYRELSGSEFLDRLNEWHTGCSWFQCYSMDNRYDVRAPAPRDIAEAIYGRRINGNLRIDEKLRKAAIERLLPCIVDKSPLPRDMVASSVRRVINRMGFEREKGVEAEWEKCLGIACALVRGSRRSEENYQMSLEEDRTTRDYLFGRLLAIAENIERLALDLANENRDTSAAKLMQRFADHPYPTWRSIELALTPYKTRLRSNRPGVLLVRDKLLDSVICMFSPEDYTNESKLSGEFLLGYHCQRAALWAKGKPEVVLPGDDESAVEGETI